MASFELVEPHSLPEAFDLLDDDPAIRPIGGGTALMLMMKSQLFKPVRLVSLRSVGPRLDGISLSDDATHIRIGAMTTFSELEHSPLIAKYLPVIPQTMKTLANVRVRNVATVGGNLAHGDPHLDLPPVWTALDASVVISSPDGMRTVPVQEIFAGYYENTLSYNEIITELHVPVRSAWTSTYVKVTTRAAHDWPALSIAVSGACEDRHVKDIRIVLGAAVDTPTRLASAENALRGKPVDERVLHEAGDAAISEVDIEADSRGSAAYKKQLLRVHLGRAMQAIAGV